MPSNLLSDLLSKMGATPFEMILTIALMIAFGMIVSLRMSLAKFRELHHRSDTLQMVTAKLIEAQYGIKLIEESADGSGDYALHRGMDNLIVMLGRAAADQRKRERQSRRARN